MAIRGAKLQRWLPSDSLFLRLVRVMCTSDRSNSSTSYSLSLEFGVCNLRRKCCYLLYIGSVPERRLSCCTRFVATIAMCYMSAAIKFYGLIFNFCDGRWAGLLWSDLSHAYQISFKQPAAHFSTRSCFPKGQNLSPILMEPWSTSFMVYLLNGLSHWFHCSIIEFDHILFNFDDGDSCNHHKTWLSINFNDLDKNPSLQLTKNCQKFIKKGERTHSNRHFLIDCPSAYADWLA